MLINDAQITGSLTVNASSSFQNIIVSGNILPDTNSTRNLGSVDKYFKEIYVSTGSINFVDSGSVKSTISSAPGGGIQIGSVVITTSSISFVDSTGSVTQNIAQSSSVGPISDYATSASFNSYTSSTDTILSSLQTTSASVNISVSAINTFTSSTSARLNSIETVSSSNLSRLSSLENKSGSLATTGSNTFFGTQTFSGSVYIANDLIVQGSSSIQYITGSSVNIGTNIVQLNTANPSVRFAGLTIIDSGSVGGSGSFLYDSVQDEFIFVHRGDGTNVTSSHFVLGPETYDNLGNETYLTNNRLPKGTGKEHLVDSQISDDGTTVSIGGALTVTGNITGPIRATNGVVSGSSQVDLTTTTNYASGILTRLNAVGVFSGSAQVTGIGNAQLTNSSFNIGTTSISLGRASASQTLTGVSIDGNAATVTGGVYTSGDQTIAGAKTFSNRVVFNSAVDNRPQLPGGMLGLNTGDGNFDIWGISRDYYPSHATSANAWGLRWNGDNNDFEFVGGGTSRVILDMDGGNITATGTIGASNFSGTHSGTSSGTNTGDQTNISGTANNITAYTINQSVGTSNAPTFAGGTINGSLYVNANNDVTTLAGSLTLYSSGNATTSMIMFKNTTGLGYGNHGAITGTYNTYFVQDTTDRGWIFRNATTSTNVASISNTGVITTTTFSGALTGNVTGNIYGARFQFDSYGNWTGGTAGGAAIVNSNEAQYQALMIVGNSSAGGVRVVKMWDNVQVQGAMSATADITAYFSDGRLKENLQPLKNAISKITTLTGYTYNTNALGKKLLNNENVSDSKVGLIAQDLQKVLPEAVKLAPFDNDGKNNSKSGENYLTIQYEKVVPLLIEAIKEQQIKIDNLTIEVENLKKPKGL